MIDPTIERFVMFLAPEKGSPSEKGPLPYIGVFEINEELQSLVTESVLYANTPEKASRVEFGLKADIFDTSDIELSRLYSDMNNAGERFKNSGDIARLSDLYNLQMRGGRLAKPIPGFRASVSIGPNGLQVTATDGYGQRLKATARTQESLFPGQRSSGGEGPQRYSIYIPGIGQPTGGSVLNFVGSEKGLTPEQIYDRIRKAFRYWVEYSSLGQKIMTDAGPEIDLNDLVSQNVFNERSFKLSLVKQGIAKATVVSAPVITAGAQSLINRADFDRFKDPSSAKKADAPTSGESRGSYDYQAIYIRGGNPMMTLHFKSSFELPDRKALEDKFRAAVDPWVQNTQAGRDLLWQAFDEMNIGDLEAHGAMDDPEFIGLLKDQGIEILNDQAPVASTTIHCVYDTALVSQSVYDALCEEDKPLDVPEDLKVSPPSGPGI